MADSPENPKRKLHMERRQYIRIHKNFILTYYDKKRPDEKYEITQLKNISMGGMCFVTSRAFANETNLAIELKTPYLSDVTYLEGLVHESHEKVKDMLYETRLEFKFLNPQAEYLLAKLIEFFVSSEEDRDA